MAVSPLLRPLGITAAILGTLQGVIWTVLTILVILLSTGGWTPQLGMHQYFKRAAQIIFFTDHEYIKDAFIFTGDVVLGFSCFYVVASFFWTVSSLTLTWVFFREKYEHARLTSITWCAITGVLVIVDVALMIILAVDLAAVEDLGLETDKFLIRTVIGTAMTIVARGYVLLIVNAVIAYFLYKFANEVSPPQCQGITWSVLTILAILIRQGRMQVAEDTDSFARSVYDVIFFPKDLEDDLIMTADTFMGFSGLYFTLSFLWAIISLILLWGLYNKLWMQVKWTVYPWCGITGTITFFDFLLIILFSLDFEMVATDSKISSDSQAVFTTQVVIGVVMTIAARGYVLLIAHIGFVAFLCIWATQINVEDYGSPKLTMSPHSRWHTVDALIPRVSSVPVDINSKRMSNSDTLQIRHPLDRVGSYHVENKFGRPKSMEPTLANILFQQEESRRVSKTGPPPPPKPSPLRPSSRY